MSHESNQVNFWGAVERIRERDKRYSQEAYALVMDSLEFAIRRIGVRRHLSAEELLVHLCDHAKERYGVLAFSILKTWGLRSTEDVGAVVYRLIDEHVLTEQDGDSPADFNGVFDLGRRLEEHYFDHVVTGFGPDQNPGTNPGAG
jgi:uncharacterized repeat protein (TIGR04138 family)